MIPIPPDVQAALSADFNLTPTDLTYLGGGGEGSDGTAFRYTQDGQARVLKILALPGDDPHNQARMAARLAFAHFLGQRGARIVTPLPDATGRLYTERAAGQHIFVAYRMPYIQGRHPMPVDWTPDMLRAWGQMIGAAHRITRSYPIWQSVTQEGTEILSWQQEWDDFYRWCRDPQVKEYWLVMREKLAALPIQRDSFGFIHNDPFAENILVEGDGSQVNQLTLLDFDVANCHWFISDIAIALQSVLFKVSGGMDKPLTDLPAAQRFLTHLMEGYQREASLDPFWLEQLNLFINYRRALLFTVEQDWLDTKPALQASWKAMILAETPVF